MVNMRNVFTTSDMAKALGVSRAHVQHLVGIGELPHKMFNNKVLYFNAADIRRAVRNRNKRAASEQAGEKRTAGPHIKAPPMGSFESVVTQ